MHVIRSTDSTTGAFRFVGLGRRRLPMRQAPLWTAMALMLGCTLYAQKSHAQASGNTVLATAVRVAETRLLPQLAMQDNQNQKAIELATITRAIARSGQFARAFAIADAASPSKDANDAYAEIAEIAVSANATGYAQQAIHRMVASRAWTASRALAKLASAYRNAGQLQRAADLIRRIEDPRERAMALVDQVRSHPQGAPWIAVALREAREAATAISTYGIHFPMYDTREATLLEVMRLDVERANFKEASATLQAIGAIGPDTCYAVDHDQRRICNNADAISDAWTARAMLVRAHAFAIAGNTAMALDDLHKASVIVVAHLHAAYDPYGRSVDAIETLVAIGRQLQQLDRNDAAAQVLGSAARIAKRLEPDVHSTANDGRISSATLYVACAARVSAAYASINDQASAMEWLRRAQTAAQALPQPATSDSTTGIANNLPDRASSLYTDDSEAMAWVAAAAEAAGDTDQAERALDEASAWIHQIPSAEWRQYAWRGMARAFLTLNGLERAVAVVSRLPHGDADRALAVAELVQPILASKQPQRLLPLLTATNDDGEKLRLITLLANKCVAPESDHLVDEALTIIAHGAAHWDWSLVWLGGHAPGTQALASATRRTLLRQIEDLALR